jgi:hypothetical protein
LFAGRKTSGLGVGGITPTMLEMTEEKMIVFKVKPNLIGGEKTPCQQLEYLFEE